MLVGGHGEVNPNTNWLQSKGLWFSYCLGILAIHLVLLSVPFFTVPIAWTVTNVVHNAIHLIFLHTLKGTPWLSQDQGACRILTHWEQIDDGLQFTQTRKFLSVMPIVLFFLTSFYTKYDPVHFYINFISLVIVLLPKLPHFHKVFLFSPSFSLTTLLFKISYIWNRRNNTSGNNSATSLKKSKYRNIKQYEKLAMETIEHGEKKMQ